MSLMLMMVVACSAPSPSQSTTASATAPASATSVGGVGSIDSPLASPLPTPEIPPTKVAGTGIVKGQLLEAGKAFPGRVLYLATLVKDAAGNETSARLDRNEATRAISNLQGEFTFYNVQPGRYAIIIDTVRDAYMLRKPANDGDLIFEVTVDGTTDLGVMNYDQLPR